jgi:HD superfamily phosphohydrolase YqeK
MVMESRDPPDLSSYPQDIAEGSGDYCAMEIDIRGAKVVGVYLSLLPLDEFKGIDSEFTALALKYNLPIILEKTDQLIDPRAFFEGLINDKDFVETLRRRGIYTDDYKERARKLVVTPEGATASPSAAKINSQPQIGEVEAEVMASLHGAEEFREAVFDLYEEYRFPTPKEKSPTRHKHTGNVTETALLIARIYGLSDYWMRILWKAALLHDVGQARAVDYGLCKDIRTFAMAHKIPHKTQLAIRELERNRREVTDAVIADMPQEFFRRIKEAGFDMSLYGKEREKRVERACKALLHESYSRQILRERINSLHIEVEEEVEWIVGYHSYPEVLPLNINPMIKTVTEILHAADAINARNDAERNIFYGRPVDFEHALAHGEQFIINAYRAGIFSFEVLQATARVVRGYRDEFRRIIMSTRCLPENTPWPEYDVKYRSTPLEIILAQAEPNAVALVPRLLSEIYDVAELTVMPLNQTLQTDEPAPLKPPSRHSDIAILQSA